MHATSYLLPDGVRVRDAAQSNTASILRDSQACLELDHRMGSAGFEPTKVRSTSREFTAVVDKHKRPGQHRPPKTKQKAPSAGAYYMQHFLFRRWNMKNWPTAADWRLAEARAHRGAQVAALKTRVSSLRNHAGQLATTRNRTRSYARRCAPLTALARPSPTGLPQSTDLPQKQHHARRPTTHPPTHPSLKTPAKKVRSAATHTTERIYNSDARATDFHRISCE